MIFRTPELTEQELRVIARIDRVRDALRHQLPDQHNWVGLLRRVMLARAIQGSNSIEGYNVSLDDAVAAVAGEPPLDAEDGAWRAVVGYRDAMTYVLQLADDTHFAYDENLIRGLHYMMLSYALDKSPGRWRPGSVFVVDEATHEVVYTGPDAMDVPDLMHELVDELRAADQVPPMVKAAMAHLSLAMIHPFRDGNGRMARCLQTLVLAREGIVASPFVSIEEYLGANTGAYYRVLQEVGQGTWRPERDARPWIRFVLTAHYRQALTMIRRAEEAERRWTLLTREATRLKLPERSVPALFNAALQFRLRNADYREVAEVNEHIAGRDLGRLVASGLLGAKGERRGRYYVATARLLALDASIRTERKPVEDPFTTAMGETPSL
ncbi:MAG: Fic family protein [Chloroflexi bacterium]|nr:Fic family protein [Chloroflexota bacterium]